jgi:hypothetical protein
LVFISQVNELQLNLNTEITSLVQTLKSKNDN